MTTLDEIRPAKKINVIDLVHDAGLDISDWQNYGNMNGENPPSQNPKYCYDWSFVDSNELIILCLWHNNFAELNGKIFQQINFNDFEKENSGVRKSRVLKMHSAVKLAYNKNLPVRVIISLSNDGTRKRVNKRVLDSEPWTVTFYNENTGVCTLERGLKAPRFVDQFYKVEEPMRREVTTMAFVRSADVRRKVLDRAKGHCEYCDILGFKMANDEIYLETHHIKPLSEGGMDNTSNVTALCPNHHREAHHGKDRHNIFSALEKISSISIQRY